MAKYDIDAFYKNMQSIITEKGIKPKEIYTTLGMRQSNYSNAFHRKNGKRFTMEQMLSIAELLCCSLDEMFTKENDVKGVQYVKIPEMSKWTCSDLLQLLFSLRKCGGGVNFANTLVRDYPYTEEVEVTSIYFTKRFDIKNVMTFIGHNDGMLINSVLREWAQIQLSTENVDAESREIMLSTWEKKKLEQHKDILLNDELITYDMDEKTRQYFQVERNDPFHGKQEKNG